MICFAMLRTRDEIIKWLRDWLTSGACSIRLVTDVESAVADVGTFLESLHSK